jgi:hypothetical protein
LLDVQFCRIAALAEHSVADASADDAVPAKVVRLAAKKAPERYLIALSNCFSVTCVSSV